MSSEDNDFSDKQCKALLKSPSPLRDIFNHWEHQPTGHMEEIRESIESHANKIIRDDFIRSKRVER